MRYSSGLCKFCPAQTKHIPGGFVHASTGLVWSKVNGEHKATPTYEAIRIES